MFNFIIVAWSISFAVFAHDMERMPDAHESMRRRHALAATV